MTKVGFHPAAAVEFRAAAAYYERRVAGLGEEFITEVERVAALIFMYPALGSQYDAVHHRMGLRRFPFRLIYRVERSTVTIVAIAHTKRRPGYWRGRA